MKNSKLITVFFILTMGYTTFSEKESCEDIPIIKPAFENCTTPEERDNKDFLENDKCFRWCYQEKLGIHDDNGRLTKELVNEVFNSYIKNKEIAQIIEDVHNECVDKAADVDDLCEMAYTYYKCISASEKMKNAVENNFCEDTKKSMNVYL